MSDSPVEPVEVFSDGAVSPVVTGPVQRPHRPETLSLREFCAMMKNDNPVAVANWLGLRPGWTLDTEVGAKAYIALRFLMASTRPEILDKKLRYQLQAERAKKTETVPTAHNWTPGQTIFNPGD